jgi:hypothetical protein
MSVGRLPAVFSSSSPCWSTLAHTCMVHAWSSFAACAHAAADPLDRRVGTVGRVHPHMEAKVVDPATGRTLLRGQVRLGSCDVATLHLLPLRRPEGTLLAGCRGRPFCTGVSPEGVPHMMPASSCNASCTLRPAADGWGPGLALPPPRRSGSCVCGAMQSCWATTRTQQPRRQLSTGCAPPLIRSAGRITKRATAAAWQLAGRVHPGPTSLYAPLDCFHLEGSCCLHFWG